jgi:predicted nucleic acid-binding Zn ribbon protein
MERWRPRGRDLDARDDPGAPPREVGEVVRGLLAESPMRRGVALGRLVRAWDRVVGPQLSREARPVGLEQGALLVAASDGAWAAQIRFLTEEIRRRANEELGAEEIRSVRVVVGLSRQGGAPAD